MVQNKPVQKVCAITGTGGYVGGGLKNYLAARGREILELTRRPAPGARAVAFQLGAEVSPQALAGVGALVHCAYDFQPLRWKEIYAVNVAGTQKLFQAAHTAGVDRIVCLSSISAYDGCRSVYGRAKLDIEKMALDSGALVVRPGLVFGSEPGLRRAGVSGIGVQPLNAPVTCEMENHHASATQAGGMFGKLVAQIRKSSVIPLIGDGSQIQFLVHNEDLAAFIEKFIAGKIEMAPRVLTAAHDRPWPFRELLSEIARGLDKKVKLVPLPWWLVWAGLKSAETCGLRLKFRSDSVVSLMHQNPAPDFSPNQAAGLTCRPFEVKTLKL